MREIKSLSGIDFDTIFKAFDRAFADYEVRQNKLQLQAMLKRRGFDPKLSFAAFEGDDIIAFTYNGTGDFNGIPTAYDTGTGTLKEYRGQGLATRIFEYSIPHLRKAGIRQYLLEVLQHNTKAVSVYKNIGFKITREFNYFMQKNEDIHNADRKSGTPYAIKEIDFKEFGSIPEFRDFQPSWQNSFDSIKRSIEGFVSLGVFTGGKLVGYCVFEPTSGDVTQIAVDRSYRRKGIASLLIREIVKLNEYDSVKVINADTSCASMTSFLKAMNIEPKGKQFEMTREI